MVQWCTIGDISNKTRRSKKKRQIKHEAYEWHFNLIPEPNDQIALQLLTQKLVTTSSNATEALWNIGGYEIWTEHQMPESENKSANLATFMGVTQIQRRWAKMRKWDSWRKRLRRQMSKWRERYQDIDFVDLVVRRKYRVGEKSSARLEGACIFFFVVLRVLQYSFRSLTCGLYVWYSITTHWFAEEDIYHLDSRSHCSITLEGFDLPDRCDLRFDQHRESRTTKETWSDRNVTLFKINDELSIIFQFLETLTSHI